MYIESGIIINFDSCWIFSLILADVNRIVNPACITLQGYISVRRLNIYLTVNSYKLTTCMHHDTHVRHDWYHPLTRSSVLMTKVLVLGVQILIPQSHARHQPLYYFVDPNIFHYSYWAFHPRCQCCCYLNLLLATCCLCCFNSLLLLCCWVRVCWVVVLDCRKNVSYIFI